MSRRRQNRVVGPCSLAFCHDEAGNLIRGVTNLVLDGKQMAFDVGIQVLIQAFLSADRGAPPGAKDAVRRYGFLPLYFGWCATVGLRPDGSFVLWHHDNGPDAIEPCTNSFLQRMALCQAVESFPALRTLIPPRPVQGVTCHVCSGTGEVGDHFSRLICVCGGLGWLIPDEDLGPPVG